MLALETGLNRGFVKRIGGQGAFPGTLGQGFSLGFGGFEESGLFPYIEELVVQVLSSVRPLEAGLVVIRGQVLLQIRAAVGAGRNDLGKGAGYGSAAGIVQEGLEIGISGAEGRGDGQKGRGV